MTAGIHGCEISQGEIDDNGSSKHTDPVQSDINDAASNCRSCLTTNDVEIQFGKDCCLVRTDCIVVGKSKEGVVVDVLNRSHDVAKEPVSKTSKAASVVEVQEFYVPAVAEASEAELVTETQESGELVAETFETSGAMVMREECCLKMVDNLASGNFLILESDKRESLQVGEVGELKSDKKPELISNAQVEVSEEPHMGCRSIAASVKKHEESEGEVVKECVNESQTDIQLNDPQDEQVLPYYTVCAGLTTESKSEVSLETKSASDPVLIENQISQLEQGGKYIGENQKDSQLKEGPYIVPSLPSAIFECHNDKNNEDYICCTSNDTKSEDAVENGAVGGDTISAHSEKFVSSEIRIEFDSFSPCQNIPILCCGDMETEVPSGDIELTNDTPPIYHVNGSHRSESITGLKSEFEAKHSSVVCVATDPHNVDTEVIRRPFYYLVKIPRFEDEKLSEEISHAKLQVEEKRQQRDAIRAEIQNKRSNLQDHRKRFEAANAEGRTTWKSIKLIREEIDSLQSVINRVENAIYVDHIDKQIQRMEYEMKNEEISSIEEKEFIRGIKRLKYFREQLSSNMGSPEEVQQALDHKDQSEVQLKKLKKELASLKDIVSKTESTKVSARKKYGEESKRLMELEAQYNAANDSRQEAYAHLLRLCRQLNEKCRNFRVYKGDASAAYVYGSRGDKEALHRLCVGQVEQVMGLLNKDDEFRKEYVRCNMRSTVGRFGTLDSRLLGPDEDPNGLSPNVDEKVGPTELISVPSHAKSEAMVANVQQDEQVSPPGKKLIAALQKSIEIAGEQNIQNMRTDETVKSIGLSGSTTDKVEEYRKEEQEKIRSEEEWDRKAEIEVVNLKEKHGLEEKAKAMEALERKKKSAEKAQMRAELRAQKVAEEREKEREKRMRKKAKKKAVVGNVNDDNNINGEDSAAMSGMATIQKESGVKESSSTINGVNIGTTSKEGQQSKASAVAAALFGKQSRKMKTMAPPPPLRNKGKRKMQQLVWVITVALLVLGLFYFASC